MTREQIEKLQALEATARLNLWNAKFVQMTFLEKDELSAVNSPIYQQALGYLFGVQAALNILQIQPDATHPYAVKAARLADQLASLDTSTNES